MRTELIITEKDYLMALDEISALFDALLGSPEGDRLNILVTLVELYEEKHFPMEFSTLNAYPS